MKPTCFITVFAVAAKFAPGYAQAGSSDQIFFGVDLTGCQSTLYPNAAAEKGDFLSNLLPGVKTETFEDFANNAGSPLALGFDGGPLTADLTSVGATDATESKIKNAPQGDACAISPSKYWRERSAAFTLDFNQGLAALGFFVTDLKAVQTLIVTLLPPEDVTTAGGAVVKKTREYTVTVSGGTGEQFCIIGHHTTVFQSNSYFETS
jgi:hypothetical protein